MKSKQIENVGYCGLEIQAKDYFLEGHYDNSDPMSDYFGSTEYRV